jgi:hypothetical protein
MKRKDQPDRPNLEENEQERRKAVIEEISAELTHEDHGTEAGAPLARTQNRTPAEEHRGGPLPNLKK